MAASKTDRQVFVLFPPREVQIHPTAPPWLALDPRLPVVVSGVKFLRQILQKSCVAGLTTRCLLGRVLQHTAVFILIRFQQLLRAGRGSAAVLWLTWHAIQESGIAALCTGSVDAARGLQSG